MFFNFLKKKIVVDTFTNNPLLAQSTACIQPAARFYPDWWKATNKTFSSVNGNNMVIDGPTIKSCQGIIDLYKNSFILPLWSDLVMEVYEDNYSWQWAELSSPDINSHPPAQFDNPVNNLSQWHHAKFVSPWFCVSKSDIKFACVEPVWTTIENNYFIKYLSGVIDFKYQHSMNINMFIPKIPRRLKFDFAQPIYQIIPLTDSYEIEFKPQVVDSNEWSRLTKITTWRPFFRRNHVKTCPFKGKLYE